LPVEARSANQVVFVHVIQSLWSSAADGCQNGGVRAPDTHYARSGDVSIAYQVIGDGSPDLVVVRGSLSDLSSVWDQPLFVQHVERLASFSRVLMFDKRGMGLSDRVREVPPLEARMDDVRAVMDSAGAEQAVLFGAHEGSRIAVLFAATYPERTLGLALYDPSVRGRKSADYPWARDEDEWRTWLREVADGWGTARFLDAYLARYSPTVADDDEFRLWFVRHMRQSASPGAAVAYQRMVMEGDVSNVLPSISVPTLIAHRAGSRGPAAYVASRIRNARLVEIPGLVDGFSWADPLGNERLLDTTEEFVRELNDGHRTERVLATILFTDIVGSTQRAAALGDGAWKELLGRHHALVRRELARFRGTEISTAGDGFLASFDAPGRAIQCSVAIRDALRPLDVSVRQGLHTGEIERMGSTIGGIAVHVAARVAALASADEILVSRTVRDLVGGSGINFVDRGTHSLKGVPEEWQVFAVD
jgi:class 3 adenylate cyclase